MTEKQKRALIIGICAGVVLAVVIGLGIYFAIGNADGTESVALADVSSPTNILAYIKPEELDLRQYKDRFAAKVEPAATELIEIPRKNADILNVLAICTDEENGNTVSDMLIVVSLNTVTGEIRMISLGGDTYVPIEGHGWDKLSMAMAYGGPVLTVNTVNLVFDLDIAQYAVLKKQDITDFFEQVAPLNVEMTIKQAEILSTYYKWDVHPGLNLLDAKQLTAMVSLRDYYDGVSVDGEKIMVTDVDRMDGIRMVARAVFYSLRDLDKDTLNATLDLTWNKLDTNCNLQTVKDGVQTAIRASRQDEFPLNATSLPALNQPTYVEVQPEGYEQSAMATLYNYISLRKQISHYLYGVSK